MSSLDSHLKRIVARTMLVIAVACGVLYLYLPWQTEKPDFDILGISLLIANAPKLLVGGFGAVCFIMGIGYWVVSRLSD